MTLPELQKKLKKFKFDAFLISRSNLFTGQDIRDDENIIKELTGFTGSAGTLLILPEKSILFVDGRYELQAPQQTNGKGVDVVCTAYISLKKWLHQNLTNKKIGYNPWCWNINDILSLDMPNLESDENFLPFALTDKAMNTFEHQLQFCGKSREEKVSELSEYIKEKDLSAYLITSADSVSWLLNLRSDTLPETPVFRAWALIDTERHVWIFADNIKTQNLTAKLTFLPLEELPARLKKFKRQSVGTDFNETSAALLQLAENCRVSLVNTPDFCLKQKALKNDCELKGIRQAHVRDGVAMCKFLYWLDHNWSDKTELDIVEKLHSLRAKQKYFVSESFKTIAAVGSNGAIVHYTPSPETNKKLSDGTLLLLDSGAQYLDGTTDITRTIALGTIPQEMCEDFTLVLKAHIHLSDAVFPVNTSGAKLDTLAREVLWKEGKNYNHGTGHGVGCFLNVHEGPQYISAACRESFSAGQITSVEPGYYKKDCYGIRIENLVETTPAAYDGFLKFKILTLVPIDKRAINKYLLTDEETAWLNRYHQQVCQTITPYLTDAEKEWLEQACSPL